MEQVFTSTRTLRIAGRQAIAVPTVRGSRVEVTGGRAWLTIERDERDFVLPSGGVFDCDIDGLLVIEMLDEGTLTVAVSSSAPDASSGSRSRFIGRVSAAWHLAPEAICQS